MLTLNEKEIINQVQHRPYGLPNGPWIMQQQWDDLLFLHWPILVEEIKELVPEGLKIDTFDGFAWIGIVPFQMNEIHLRGLPSIPFASSLTEINVRTYVSLKGKPGVYFFSLDANHRLAVWIANTLFHLPYFKAKIDIQKEKSKVYFDSRRRNKKGAQFKVNYQPISEPYQAKPGQLDHWLTERYCLYTSYKDSLYCGEIHHLPWPLQRAEWEIERDTLSLAEGIRLPIHQKAIGHYASHLHVFLWPLFKV